MLHQFWQRWLDTGVQLFLSNILTNFLHEIEMALMDIFKGLVEYWKLINEKIYVEDVETRSLYSAIQLMTIWWTIYLNADIVFRTLQIVYNVEVYSISR